ncbi:MAG: hypothetical protein WBB73_17645 [Candidatus Aminicenantaceae bacterium]
MIGSVLDLSGTYYNPGGLSLIETEAVELLMFAKVFHFPTISIEGLGPEENRLNSTDLGEAPSLFAGSIPIKGLGKHWLGYSYLTRSHTKLELTGAVVGDYDFGGVFPDGIPTGVDSQIYERLNEPWYGLTWAYRLSDYVGIGISQYVTYRSHWMAALAVSIGEIDEGFTWLDKAFRDQGFWIRELNVDPLFSGVRDDPRFGALVTKLGLD